MEGYLGSLIRRERLKRHLSQEGLCSGICAVSYLSKIEQGKVDAGDDILQQLLERLGVQPERDRAFLNQAEKAIALLYEFIFSGMEELPQFQDKLNWLAGRRDRCLASPYMVDTLLLLTYCGKSTGGGDAEEFVPVMTRSQYEFWLLLRVRKAAAPDEGAAAADELLRLNDSSFYTCTVAAALYEAGKSAGALPLFLRSYEKAAAEGRVQLMLRCKLYLGSCYSEAGQKELMLQQFEVARRIAGALQSELWSATVDYRLGSACLEWGMAEEAYALLQPLSRHDGVYYHRMALVMEKLGRTNEALSMLSRAKAAPVEAGAKPYMKEILALAEYRLRRPNREADGTYFSMMRDTFALLRRQAAHAQVRLHLPYMLQALEAERRYKEAYQLAKEFSRLG